MSEEINKKPKETIVSETQERLQAAVNQFCKKHDWAVDWWKNQPHIKALFDLRTDVK